MAKPKRTVRYYQLCTPEGEPLSKWDTRKDKLVRAARELKRNTMKAIRIRSRVFLKPSPVSVQPEPAQ